jgi:eukaryotic-like serine/threonine-protein kinase
VTTVPHPEADRLAAYLLGKLSWAELERMEVHLDGCAPCRSRVAALEGSADSFLSCLRRAATESADDPALDSLLAKARVFVQSTVGPPPSHSEGPSGQLKEAAGMSITSAAKLLDVLLEHRIVRPEQLEKINSSLRGQPLDPRALAKRLIDQDWVTAYQINQLFRGQGAELVLGEYLLLDKLGQGGMGQVFKARHQLMNRVVALKVIRQERLTDPGLLARFRREIQLVAKLTHPNIVTAHDAQVVGDSCFLVMEYVEGTDLQRLVRSVGPLPVGQACAYIRQAALGLQHASEHDLVHRDVKPSNLQVTANGKVVKVLDMGLARLLTTDGLDQSADGMTQDHAILGTPDYIAPEQIDNPRHVDIRADIYSLGCAFYFLLAGRPPFSGLRWEEKLVCHRSREPQPIEQDRPDVPPALAAILRKMMAKQREARYSVPIAVADALAPFSQLARPVVIPVTPPVNNPTPQSTTTETGWTLSSDSTNGPVPDPIAPEPPASVEPAPPASTQEVTIPMPPTPKRRKPLWLVLAAVAALLALLILVPLFWPKGSDQRPHDANEASAGSKGSEVAGPRVLIDEDFREPFENKLLLPEGWSSQGLSIVKDKDRHALRVSRPDGTHFVTLPPIALSGNFSIEGVYLLGHGGWNWYTQTLTVSLENRGQSALLTVVFKGDGSTGIDKETSLPPSTFVLRRPTHFLVKREGKKLRLFLDKDPVASKELDEIVEYDTLRLGLDAGADVNGVMARLYTVKVATLPP